MLEPTPDRQWIFLSRILEFAMKLFNSILCWGWIVKQGNYSIRIGELGFGVSDFSNFSVFDSLSQLSLFRFNLPFIEMVITFESLLKAFFKHLMCHLNGTEVHKSSAICVAEWKKTEDYLIQDKQIKAFENWDGHLSFPPPLYFCLPYFSFFYNFILLNLPRSSRIRILSLCFFSSA